MSDAAAKSHHDDHGHGAHHEEHAPPSRYILIWFLLLVGTAVTLWTAKMHIPDPWGNVVALGIATGKSTLVVLFFMHLWEHGGANRLIIVVSLVFLVLLLGISVADVKTRFPLTVVRGSEQPLIGHGAVKPRPPVGYEWGLHPPRGHHGGGHGGSSHGDGSHGEGSNTGHEAAPAH